MDVDLLDKFLEENGGTSELLRHIPVKEITVSRLNDIHQRLEDEGTKLAIAHYGTITNAVAGNPPPADDIIRTAVQIIHKSLKLLRADVNAVKNQIEQLTPEDLLEFRRALAVHIYLVHKALTGMESKAVREGNEGAVAVSGKKGRGKNAPVMTRDSVGPSGSTWDSRRNMLVEDLHSVMDLPVDKIWDDDVAGGFSLPRLLIRTMCTNLNETFLAKGNLAAGPEAYKILGILAKRFNKQEDVLNRITPFIKSGEDVARVVARVIDIMVKEFEMGECVPVALRASYDLAMAMPIKDLNAEKGYASFITELCSCVQEQMVVLSTNTLLDFLGADSGPIRSAVLNGAWSLLRWLNDNEGTGSGNRTMRDCFIKRMLILHTKDVNATVRSKALTLLTKLISNGDLEEPEIASVLKYTIPRLKDKASSVRKHAAALLCAIISGYPIIAKSNAAPDFQHEVDEARKHLLEILVKNTSKAKAIYGLVNEFLEQAKRRPITLPEEFEPLENMEAVRKLITLLLKDDKYWEACTVLWTAFDRFGSSAGVTDAAETMGVATVYLEYFKISRDGDGSELEESITISQSTEDSSGRNKYSETEEVQEARKKLKCFEGCAEMAKLLPEVVNCVASLLDCGSEADRSEMINIVGLLVRCGYSVKSQLTASVVKAISHMQTSNASDILPAFMSIFIGDEQIAHVEFLKKLFGLLQTVTPTVKEHLKPIIAEMYKCRKINKPVIQSLWEAFSSDQPSEWTESDSESAIFVLGIIGASNRSLILDKMSTIVEKGFSDDSIINRMSLVKYTLEALLHSLKKNKKGESDINDTIRFSPDHPLWSRLIFMLEKGITIAGNMKMDVHFPAAAELALQIIYRLSWNPQDLTKQLLTSVISILFGDGEKIAPTSEIKQTERAHIRYLSLLRSMLGSHINFHENVVLPEVKRRKTLGQNNDGGGTGKGGKKKKQTKKALNSNMSSKSSEILNSSRSSARSGRSVRNTSTSIVDSSTSITESSHLSSGAENATVNNEMDVMIGNVGYDVEQEMVRNYIDKMLDSGVFRHFRILTMNFCRSFKKLKSLKLQIECVKALAKIMSVSAESVSKHMETFLAIWSEAKSPLVKIELVKQCTVLNIRFPNQMEACNAVVHKGLQETDDLVKLACVDFMTYLALGDMVKVRDYIADVALLLCDSNGQIRDMAKDFFNTCAEKDNVMSNAVPEVISRLSIKKDLSQQSFQEIMRFLLVRVTKEKQVLGLVEKLVARFKGPAIAGHERSWQDTAFCISQLPLPDKAFKLFKDNFQLYADKLHDDGVYESFINIVDTLKKSEKPEFATKIEDFEKQIEDAREKCLETKRIENAGNRAQERVNRADDSSDMEGIEEDGEGNQENQNGENDNSSEENEGSSQRKKKKQKEQEVEKSKNTSNESMNETDGEASNVEAEGQQVSQRATRNSARQSQRTGSNQPIIKPEPKDSSDQEEHELSRASRSGRTSRGISAPSTQSKTAPSRKRRPPRTAAAPSSQESDEDDPQPKTAPSRRGRSSKAAAAPSSQESESGEDDPRLKAAPSRRERPSKAVAAPSSQESDEDDPPPKAAPSRRGRSSKAAAAPSSQESDEDDPPPKAGPSRRGRSSKAAAAPSSQESDDDDFKEEPKGKKVAASNKPKPKVAKTPVRGAKKPRGGGGGGRGRKKIVEKVEEEDDEDPEQAVFSESD